MRETELEGDLEPRGTALWTDWEDEAPNAAVLDTDNAFAATKALLAQRRKRGLIF